jgi:hypothetical protein
MYLSAFGLALLLAVVLDFARAKSEADVNRMIDAAGNAERRQEPRLLDERSG